MRPTLRSRSKGLQKINGFIESSHFGFTPAQRSIGKSELIMRSTTLLAPLTLLAAAFVSASPTPRDVQARWAFPAEVNVLTATVKDLQEFLSNGTITSVQLTQHYLVSGTII